MTPRRASEGDAREIAAIERAAASQPWSEEAVRSSLALPTTLGWVVGEPVVGHLLASWVGDEGEILTLGVHPGERRRGHASALMDACEEAWRAAGVVNAWLEVRADNVAARSLYARRGWVDAGNRPRYYADGADAGVMRWSPS